MMLATVTTIRGVDRSFFTFLSHHIQRGADIMYVVLDEPSRDDWLAAEVRARPDLAAHVHIVPRDAALQQQIEGLDLYRASPDLFELSVVTRQRLHVALVNELAIAQGVDWLVHIDADELLVPYDGLGLRDYLATVPPQIIEVLFPVFEAMPHTDRFDDPFLEIFRFKKNPCYLSAEQLHRLRYELGRPQFYLGYASGKSAFRPKDMAPLRVPASVHLFSPSLSDPFVKFEEQGGPIVLHYPMVGFVQFMKRVSGFNFNRLNEYEVTSEDQETNLFAIARRLVAKGEIGALKEMYRRWVLYDDPVEIERLRSWGVLFERPYRP